MIVDDKEINVEKGDLFAKPTLEGLTSTFINSGNTPLEILDCGYVKVEDLINNENEKILLFKNEGIILEKEKIA